jgi:hypothetical protein
LRSDHESGQPVIYEQTFPTGKVQVTVLWDAWERLSLEERTDVVLRAYEHALGRDFQDRIALASGLTFPEAHAAGMLPVQIIAAVRRDDEVTPDQCRVAMVEEGASRLFDPDRPRLLFATPEEAEAARRRLVARLPESEPVWTITQDVGPVETWLAR